MRRRKDGKDGCAGGAPADLGGAAQGGRPDSRFSWKFSEFIADYEGSDLCAENLCATEIYRNSEVVFITPDNNLETFRERAIRDKKTILMTNYGIERGVFLIAPGSVPEGKEELASTLDGVQRYWKFITLREIAEKIKHIDMLVTGASAITPSGIRFGQGARLLRPRMGDVLHQGGRGH